MPIESVGEVVFQGGPAGTDGQSTYQAWLALGNVGSVVDFIASQRGAPGPANALQIGTVSTGAPGSSASATITGQTPNQTLDLTVPQGATGAQPWQTPPAAWAPATAYTAAAPASSITYGGESYVCATSHTSAQAFDASKWSKIAQKGADGSPAAGAVLYSASQSLTPAQRQQARANLSLPGSAIVYVGTTGQTLTLAAADIGKIVVVGASGATVVLPPVAGLKDGDRQEMGPFTNLQGPFTVTTADAGTNIYTSDSYPPTPSVTVQVGQAATFVLSGSAWVMLGRAAPAASTLSFSLVQALDDGQKQKILANADIAIPHGQCRLSYVSTTQIRLDPCNGNKIFLDGKYRNIPSAGTSITNAGLSAFTLYYVYAAPNGSGVTLQISTIAPVVDPTYGHKTANTYPATTLVGMIYTDTNSQFRDDPAFRGVATYFNRRQLEFGGLVSNPVNVATSTYSNLGVQFLVLTWDEDAIDFTAEAVAANTNAGGQSSIIGNVAGTFVGQDGTGQSTAANAPVNLMSRFTGRRLAGPYTISAYGKVSAFSSSFYASLYGVVRI